MAQPMTQDQIAGIGLKDYARAKWDASHNFRDAGEALVRNKMKIVLGLSIVLVILMVVILIMGSDNKDAFLGMGITVLVIGLITVGIAGATVWSDSKKGEQGASNGEMQSEYMQSESE